MRNSNVQNSFALRNIHGKKIEAKFINEMNVKILKLITRQNCNKLNQLLLVVWSTKHESFDRGNQYHLIHRKSRVDPPPPKDGLMNI